MTQHASLWQGMKQVLCTSQIDIIPFITHPGHEKLYHTTGVSTLYEQQRGFFHVPEGSENWKSCETGPTVFFVLSDKTKKIIL